jgi:hypothetical protein
MGGCRFQLLGGRTYFFADTRRRERLPILSISFYTKKVILSLGVGNLNSRMQGSTILSNPHVYNAHICLCFAVYCEEENVVSQDSDIVIKASSGNNPDFVRSTDLPRYESDPAVDGVDNPTLTVTLPGGEDVVVAEILLNRTENVESVIVTIVDAEGAEVSILE